MISITLVAGIAAYGQQRATVAATAVEQWGATVPVIVVEQFVPAGQPLSGAIGLERRPSAMVPPSVMDAAPVGGHAAVDLFPGELLVSERVRNSDARGMPLGTLAVTVTIHGAAPLVGEGDLVDLWVTDSANFSSQRIVRAAVVLARHDDELTIAVPEDLVGDVAVAALRPLTVALLE